MRLAGKRKITNTFDRWHHAAGFVVLRFATTKAIPNINKANRSKVAIEALKEKSDGLFG